MTFRTFALLAVVAVLAAVLGFVLRYALVEPRSVGLACDAGEASLRCAFRQGLIFTFWNSLFGWLALALAVWQLWRPATWRLAVLLAVCALGLILYNTLMAATAVALAAFSLARPQRS